MVKIIAVMSGSNIEAFALILPTAFYRKVESGLTGITAGDNLYQIKMSLIGQAHFCGA